MKLEDQLVSLDLAKRMKELGFEQESLYRWDKKAHGWYLANADFQMYGSESIAAYTTAELGEMLKGCDHPVPYWCSQANVKSWCMFRDGEAYNINEKNEADARAQTLIYLKENNLL